MITTDHEIIFNHFDGQDTIRQFSIRTRPIIFVAVGQEVRARLLNAKQAGIIASKLLGIPGLIFKVIPGASPKEIISIEYKEKKYMME